jgi:adenylylsulfate kinase
MKAITWRFIATFIGMAIIFWLTGDLKLSGIVGGLDIVLKLIAYYVHERIWARISWGRRHAKRIDISEYRDNGIGNNGHHPQNPRNRL